ncbi:MAG TPA: sulfite exporter TauE/SafE family protein [Gemmatimonadales bacterium]|nr:sulfite exporter TauE/SafE family protein [Gemmatimonadales bacterium]
MNTLAFSATIAVAAFCAGFLGSLTGLGGGFIVTPVLTILFGADIRYAIGASLVSIIATSSGAAAAYVREGFTNLRVGMLLEVATVTGALVGASLVAVFPARLLTVVFGMVLLMSAYLTTRPRAEHLTADAPADRLASRLRLDSEYPTPSGPQRYRTRRVPGAFALMWVAGVLSGLLGIGSGAVKVLAMDQVMYLPFKVSTATSNFMIGVTAAASAGIYLRHGYVDPGLAMPVMLGVLAGSMVGARLLFGTPTRRLRLLFAAVIVVIGLEMIYHGAFGGQ